MLYRTKNPPMRKKDIARVLKEEKPNLIYNITGLKCDVTVNEEVYTEEDKKRLQYIIDRMADDIWIDKTYVCYDKNRFKDAFLNEDSWYEFSRLVLHTNFGNNDKGASDEIYETLLIISVFYLFGIAEKYGFAAQDIDITVRKNTSFNSEFFIDNRTSWNF